MLRFFIGWRLALEPKSEVLKPLLTTLFKINGLAGFGRKVRIV